MPSQIPLKISPPRQNTPGQHTFSIHPQAHYSGNNSTFQQQPRLYDTHSHSTYQQHYQIPSPSVPSEASPGPALAASSQTHPTQSAQTIPRSSSPVAPAYSPITPKVQPVLPAKPFVPPVENGGAFTFSATPNSIENAPQQQQQETVPQHQPQQSPPVSSAMTSDSSLVATEPLLPTEEPTASTAPAAQSSIPRTEHIPQPPNLPFSSEDAPDSIALRAAISTLQFQKKKAQEDMKTLARIKQLALDDPDRFRSALAAGDLKEERHAIGGNFQAILDQLDDGGDDEDEIDFTVLRGSTSQQSSQPSTPRLPTEIPNLQRSRPASSSQQEKHETVESKGNDNHSSSSFPRIPGAQAVVRMPYVNWSKYGIVGEPLDAMHEQQRKWPGTSGGTGQERGREYAVSAPYSPFADQLEERDEARKDSAAVSPGSGHENMMEIRRR